MSSYPSSPLYFESQKYIGAPLTVLYEPETRLFHIGTCYGSKREFLSVVPEAEVGPWLAAICTEFFRQHYDALAEAHQRSLYMEGLSPEHNAAVGSLDLGIDL